MADPTPDLLLPHHGPAPPGDPGPPPDPGAPVAPPGPSLRQSLGRLLSGSGDPQDEEWDLIGHLATACSGVLEAIARGGHQLRELPQQSPSPAEDESQRLSEKVAQLEAALKRLQEGQDAQQRLRGLRGGSRRLLRPPGTPESPP